MLSVQNDHLWFPTLTFSWWHSHPSEKRRHESRSNSLFSSPSVLIVGLEMVSMYQPKSKNKSEAGHSGRLMWCCQVSKKGKKAPTLMEARGFCYLEIRHIYGKNKRPVTLVTREMIWRNHGSFIYSTKLKWCIIVSQALN